MDVIRQERTTRIGPIGVARTGGGSDAVGNAIRNTANQIRERYYTIAANEAEDRGRERAAEVNLQSITTLDSNTMMPQALSIASGMGTVQKEAFEKAILLRFEGAITDDIRSKQAELMQRVATERNAPKLFEELFTEYLDQTGANASGYYKQIITDQGASSLEDGRSRLKVAQIARIQAEAKAAKAKSDNAFIKMQEIRAFLVNRLNLKALAIKLLLKVQPIKALVLLMIQRKVNCIAKRVLPM